MKKLLIALLAVFAISSHATVIDISLINGKHIEGVLVEQNDSILIVHPNDMSDAEEIIIKPEMVKSFYISGIGRYLVVNGKFMPTSKAQIAVEKIEQKARINEQRNSVLAANPNDVIGNAIKNTGDVCIGIGIPSLVVGSILMGVGCSDGTLSDAMTENIKKHTNCQLAGSVLMSAGGALTIIGIPLHVHGKRIAELNLNYTGNGAGVSVDF